MRIDRVASTALFFSLVLNPLQSSATENVSVAVQWLERMMDAARHLNYQGTFVYMRNGDMDSMRVLHKYDERGEQERLVSLNGDGRQVIRNNDHVVCLLAKGQQLVLDNQRRANSRLTAFPPIRGAELSRLGQHYQFEVSAEDRVAGRVAKIISIQPKDEYRYGYRLWIDRENGLLLKSNILDKNGNIMEQLMFTSMELVDSIPDQMFKIADSIVAASEAKKERPGVRSDKEIQWKVAGIPKGFTTKNHTHHQLSNGSLVQHVVMSDGLAAVSVFIEKSSANVESTPTGAAQSGILSTYTSIVNNFKVLAVGEVPMKTVQIIANSVNMSETTQPGPK
ncbi:MAG: MucB/RseB C-terminal domain-containing protein [Gammaproteobacteria bacterium]|nr:MucB/RseB C-terminal domain-containing protein [Gammaproteobacteria bacterium]MDH5691851.1 MucB/RseB C-terminal domain-containing protein [Gammaproteobacteria bacterium]